MQADVAFMCSGDGTVVRSSAEVPRAAMARIHASLRELDKSCDKDKEFSVPGGRARVFPASGHYLIVFRAEHQEAYRLTRRQREVAELAATGATIEEIARHLGISPHTVRQHLRDAYRLLDVGNRVELARALAVS